MTTYTTLSDTTLSQDKPVTQSLMRALRDNPLAITEGDTSAPLTVGLNADVEVVATNVATLAYTGGFLSAYPIYEVQLIKAGNQNSSATGIIFDYTVNGGSSWLGGFTMNTFTLSRSNNGIFHLIDPTVANGQNFFGYTANSGGNTQIRYYEIPNALAINGIRFRFDTGNITGRMIIRRQRRATNVG